MSVPIFLGDPAAISRALLDRIPPRAELKLAVAFVTAEWMRLLADFKGTGRLVCWLDSGATDPDAIVQLMKPDRGFVVQQLRGMHAKVYLSPGPDGFAVVGSANISSPALAGGDHAGRSEAGVLLDEVDQVAQIDRWFDDLWNQSKPIRAPDLERARRARAIAKRAQREQIQGSPDERTPVLPADWQPTQQLLDLADFVRDMDLRDLIPELGPWDPAVLTVRDLKHVIAQLVKWAGYPYKFQLLLREDIALVRAAFAVAFDAATPIQQRMEWLQDQNKLAGLGLPAWTMLLHYRDPESYVPYNVQTVRFIQHYGLGQASTKANPRRYALWLDLCADLAVRLHLPTRGHVDRLVWHHAKGRDEPARM